MKTTLNKSAWLLAAMLGLSTTLQAQDGATQAVSRDQLVWLLVVTMIVVAIACLVLAITILALIQAKREEVAEGEPKPLFEWSGLWRRFNRTVTDAVPVAEEKSIDLGHDYDGIRELDNRLPPWWKWGFYITIGIAVVYLWVYHVSGDWSSRGEFEMAMVQAEEDRAEYLATVANLVDETNVELKTEDAALAAGKTIYLENCALCHGKGGEGGIGPNLTDDAWLHGCDITSVFKTIKYGVVEKGMIAWETQLLPGEMQDVSSYILTLTGTNPPNPKDPEGEPCEVAAPADSTVTAEPVEVAMN